MGRKPKFSNTKQMQRKIDAYFKKCEGMPLLDKNGNFVITKNGIAYKVPPKPPTMTGLALALGFTSRQALLNYKYRDSQNTDENNTENNSGFVDTITRAKSLIEEYAETRLFDKDGANGAKFSLMNNFKGWAEKQETNFGDEPFEIKITVVKEL